MNKLGMITALMSLAVLPTYTIAHAQPPTSGAAPPRLVSVRVAKAPTVDGKADDEAWQAATPLEVVAKRVMEPNIGVSTRVSIRSVHTDTHLYFLVSWEDATEHRSHKTWVWNAEKKTYEEGSDREDMFALAFEHTGVFTADMLSGDEAVWDVWHWKAFRTNLQGYAMDKTHRYTREKPAGRANSHPARNGVTIWISRPEDAGDSVEKRQAAPPTFQGDRVPQYVPGTPSSSAADVRASGAWVQNRWTLEFARRLNTGHPDDTAFDLTRSFKMAVAAFDQTGDMDKASGIIELTFSETQERDAAK